MLESSVFVVELGVLDGNSQNVAGGWVEEEKKERKREEGTAEGGYKRLV